MTARLAEEDRGLLASTAAVTAGNLASRVTGFLRVLAVGLALGTTFAGNTYQTSNLVSNVLFELSAAGLMSSVLIPPLVKLLDSGERHEAERLAGSVLGLVLVALGVLTAAGLLLRPWIMRLLTAAVEDQAVRDQEVALGSFLLVFFLPQILLYAVGAVATGLLHGTRRFAAPAFAPVANNLAVIATMVAFWAIGPGGRPGLDLTTTERWVLGLGTTAGVAAMNAVPLLALRRAGLRLRPRWDLRQAGLARLGRDGLWATATLALGQVLIVATLVLANRVEGGVVAYHLAFQLFLLPFALLAHPVVTALYPRLASSAHALDWAAFVRQLRGGAATLAFLVLPASAVAVAVADPALRLLRLGNLDAAGTRLAAQLVAAYALGLIGYAGFQLLLRASYAAGDTRTPTLVAVGVAVGGTALMVLWFAAAGDGPGRLAAVGFGHSIAYLGGTVALAALLRRRLATQGGGGGGGLDRHLRLWGQTASPGEVRRPQSSVSHRASATRLPAALARSALCAAAAGGVALVVSRAITGGWAATALAVGLALASAAAVYVGAQRALGAPELAFLRGRTREVAAP